MKPGNNMSMPSRTTVKSVVAEALRRRIGPGALTYTEVAEAIDCEPRTLRDWVVGDNIPRLPEFLRLCLFFGPEFASETMAPAGLKARAVESGEACEFALNADLATLLASLAEALRDGHVDHREKAVLLPLARQTMTSLGCWVRAQDETRLRAVS